MSDVKHQKWWGWGGEGVAFTHDNKPGFAPFVLDQIGLDLSQPGVEPPRFEDLDVPAAQLPEDLEGTLRAAVGDHHVNTTDMDRVVHTYGKGLRDLLMVRAGMLPRVPDVVVYRSEEHTSELQSRGHLVCRLLL